MFEVINAEDAAIVQSTALGVGKDFDVAPVSAEEESRRYDIAEFEDSDFVASFR